MKEKKDYSIGFVSKLLGMSIENIRNYEKAGILLAQRSDSAYRRFMYLDVTCLIRVRGYRALGFSLKQISEMVNSADTEAIREKLLEKKAELEKEKDLLAQKQIFVDELARSIDEMKELNDQPKLRMLPGYYRLEFAKNGMINDDPQIIAAFAEWMEYTPFVHISSRYHDGDTFGGISIREDYASLFGITPTEIVHRLPGGIGISMYSSEKGGDHTDADSVKKLEAYAAYHRFQLEGDPVGHTITSITKNTAYERYREICVKIVNQDF